METFKNVIITLLCIGALSSNYAIAEELPINNEIEQEEKCNLENSGIAETCLLYQAQLEIVNKLLVNAAGEKKEELTVEKNNLEVIVSQLEEAKGLSEYFQTLASNAKENLVAWEERTDTLKKIGLISLAAGGAVLLGCLAIGGVIIGYLAIEKKKIAGALKTAEALNEDLETQHSNLKTEKETVEKNLIETQKNYLNLKGKEDSTVDTSDYNDNFIEKQKFTGLLKDYIKAKEKKEKAGLFSKSGLRRIADIKLNAVTREVGLEIKQNKKKKRKNKK